MIFFKCEQGSDLLFENYDLMVLFFKQKLNRNLPKLKFIAKKTSIRHNKSFKFILQ